MDTRVVKEFHEEDRRFYFYVEIDETPDAGVYTWGRWPRDIFRGQLFDTQNDAEEVARDLAHGLRKQSRDPVVVARFCRSDDEYKLE